MELELENFPLEWRTELLLLRSRVVSLFKIIDLLRYSKLKIDLFRYPKMKIDLESELTWQNLFLKSNKNFSRNTRPPL